MEEMGEHLATGRRSLLPPNQEMTAQLGIDMDEKVTSRYQDQSLMTLHGAANTPHHDHTCLEEATVMAEMEVDHHGQEEEEMAVEAEKDHHGPMDTMEVVVEDSTPTEEDTTPLEGHLEEEDHQEEAVDHQEEAVAEEERPIPTMTLYSLQSGSSLT